MTVTGLLLKKYIKEHKKEITAGVAATISVVSIIALGALAESQSQELEYLHEKYDWVNNGKGLY